MMRQLFIGLFLTIGLSGFSQEPDKDAGGTIMRREFSIGLNFNANAGANGWGPSFEYSFQKTYKYKHSFGFTCTNIRHPKEFSVVNINGSSRGYFYGKLNSLVCFRPTFGGKLMLFQSKRENGIEISYKWHLGPVFGLLKPVYLKIAKFNTNPIDERYNPTIHNTENISGRSPWAKGLGESEIKIGLFLKSGFDFNFATVSNKISGGEIGFMVDFFPSSSIQLANNNPSQKIFPSLYLQFNLGQRLN